MTRDDLGTAWAEPRKELMRVPLNNVPDILGALTRKFPFWLGNLIHIEPCVQLLVGSFHSFIDCVYCDASNDIG